MAKIANATRANATRANATRKRTEHPTNNRTDGKRLRKRVVPRQHHHDAATQIQRLFRGVVCRWSGKMQEFWTSLCGSRELLSELSAYLTDDISATQAFRDLTYSVCMRRIRFSTTDYVPNMAFALSLKRTGLIMMDTCSYVGHKTHRFHPTLELSSSLCRPRVGCCARRLPSDVNDVCMAFLTIYELCKVRQTCSRWQHCLENSDTERRRAADALGYMPTEARVALGNLRRFCCGSEGSWSFRRISAPCMSETPGNKGVIHSVTGLRNGKVQFVTSYGYMCTVRPSLAHHTSVSLSHVRHVDISLLVHAIGWHDDGYAIAFTIRAQNIIPGIDVHLRGDLPDTTINYGHLNGREATRVIMFSPTLVYFTTDNHWPFIARRADLLSPWVVNPMTIDGAYMQVHALTRSPVGCVGTYPSRSLQIVHHSASWGNADMRSMWVDGPGDTVSMDTHGNTTRVVVANGDVLRSVNTLTWGEGRHPSVFVRLIALPCTDMCSIHFMGSRMLYGHKNEVCCVNLRDAHLRPRAVACPSNWVREGVLLVRFYSFADAIVAIGPNGYGLYCLIGLHVPASAKVIYR